MYPDRHFAKNYTAKCTKLQTNLPVKICHLKVSVISSFTLTRVLCNLKLTKLIKLITLQQVMGPGLV